MSVKASLLGGLVVLSAGMAGAQGIPQADLDRAASEDLRQQNTQAREQAARQEARRGSSDKPPSAPAAPDPYAPAPGGPCFVINEISLEGFDAFGEEPTGHRELIGKCVTAADIGAALNNINKHYQERGFITTRAYVPQQDVADGSLDITIVPGRIEGFVYGSGKQADARLTSAFPTKRGKLLNLRDLEQGLENINGPRSAKAKFELIPGEDTGGSFVQVKVEDARPLHLSFNMENSGFETTGEIKGKLGLGLDNVLGLNDQLSFDVTSSMFVARSEKYSDAFSASWSVPVGRWSFGLDMGHSRYFFVLPGINQSYDVKGESHYATVSVETLLMRNQTAKAYAYGDLKLTRTQTWIDGFELESQRRRMTVASLGLRGEKSFAKGKFTWKLGGKFGLDAFNAYVLDKSIVNPEFRLIHTKLSYEHKLGDSGALYRGTLVAQHSNDILPGTEQFSIGGRSSVRGFHDDSMYGDTGAYVRNDLEWDAHKGDVIEVRIKAGLDVGWIKASELRKWSQDYLVGASLGADIKFKDTATLTLEVARALSRPTDSPANSQPAFEADQIVGFAGLKFEF